MKQINIFLECNFATPMNTPGMGNPNMPTGSLDGSGDIPNIEIIKHKGKRKRKHLREYLTK